MSTNDPRAVLPENLPFVQPSNAITPLPILPVNLRDYFAGLAMHGMLAADSEEWTWTSKSNLPGLAPKAYEIADAMIVARNENDAKK